MRDELILNNLNLIYFVLTKMCLLHKKDEYYDVGLIGLVKAANMYDPSKGYKFSTIAGTCIRNAILMEIRHEKILQNTISLETPVMIDYNNYDEVTLLDTIPSKFDMEEYMIEKDEYERVNKALMDLTDRELMILKMYYGPSEMTQKEIAKRIHTTQSNVSRILIKIIKKLRKDVMKGGE